MKILILLLISSFTVLLISCDNDGPVYKAIIERSKVCGKTNTSALVEFDEFTRFDWDKMYLFEELSSGERISYYTEIQYKKQVPEDHTRMIFMLNSKIVHEEDFNWTSNRKRLLDFINLPIDTASVLTTKGCFTKTFPFVKKDNCRYLLKNVDVNGSAKLYTASKVEISIRLLFYQDSSRCYDEQVRFENY